MQWGAHVAECPHQVLCQPQTQMGPVVYVRTAEAPRLYPPLPRDSATFKELMATRSGCERSNSFKKVACRSATQLLVRLALVSLLEHARAWLAEDRKPRGAHTDGRAELREAAEANTGRDRDAPSPVTAGRGEVCPHAGNLP
jgi:hypothetical protein